MDNRQTLINYDICIANTELRIHQNIKQKEDLEYFLSVLKKKRDELLNSSELEEDFPL